MERFPHYMQTDAMTCGPTCLRIISAFYGKTHNLSDLVQLSKTTRSGSNFLGLSEAAEKIGFKTLGSKITPEKLTGELVLPCIAHWNQNHFVVVYKIDKNKIYVSDPAHGLLAYSRDEFSKHWIADEGAVGVLLLLEPTGEFEEEARHKNRKERSQELSFLVKYLKPHRRSVIKLLIGLFIVSLLQLIPPFLTQSIIDIGIKNKDLSFIYLVLFAQLMVFFGRTTVDVIRSYILMRISTRINISLSSDFFIKLMKLPISYFDSKLTGDIMQRIADNSRIETFLTSSSLSTLFSLFSFVVFSVVLALYSLQILFIFLTGSVFYFLWILFFLKKRADVDYKRFHQSSQNQSMTIEMINGMQDIKLHNASAQKYLQWKTLQLKLFRINLKGLVLTITQQSGSSLINELKNIIITFFAAKLVLEGQLTLGVMLSVSYITGQLNAPIIDMVNFIQHFQDARLSLERLREIQNKEDEEPVGKNLHVDFDLKSAFDIRDLFFKYTGAGNDFVLRDLNIYIPSNKITAIVGSSGSGKSTLLKLLLKYYSPSSGSIHLNDVDLQDVSSKAWRERCGVVTQEGYIFSDTIANNIAIGFSSIDKARLDRAAEISNIREYIDSLPLGYDTKIGMEGNNISSGQKQRILIARAVYKDPDYLFFDEATSSLDANNEKIIMHNLDGFFKNRTVIIIAHRLSTVKNADQIIVLEKGKIIEQGNHAALATAKGAYFELVKNQLEMGS